MSFVDTVMGNLLHYFVPNYNSLFGVIYGYGDILPNWIWLFSSLYANQQPVLSGRPCDTQTGENSVPLPGCDPRRHNTAGGGTVRYVLPQNLVDSIRNWPSRAMGFMNGGTVNYLYPLLTLLLLAAVFYLGAYAIIRRTEVK